MSKALYDERPKYEAYEKEALDDVHADDTHEFVHVMSLIEDIFDQYDPSIVMRVLGEIMNRDHITKEQSKAKYEKYDTQFLKLYRQVVYNRSIHHFV